MVFIVYHITSKILGDCKKQFLAIAMLGTVKSLEPEPQESQQGSLTGSAEDSQLPEIYSTNKLEALCWSRHTHTERDSI